MIKIRQLTTFLWFLFVVNGAYAATNGVVIGQSFQSVVDASAAGDVLIVQPGVYPDSNIIFNKALTVLPSGTNGQPIQFMGPIQVNGAGPCSFQRANFASTVQVLTSSVSFFDSHFNAAVYIAGGKVTMKRVILDSLLTLTNNAALEALRMTNNAPIFGTATTGSGTPFLATQSWFTNGVYISGYKVWLAYNIFTNSSQLQETNCDSILLGNKFSLTGSSVLMLPLSSPAVVFSQGGTFKAYNNLVAGNLILPLNGYPVYGIWLSSNASEVVNNTVSITANRNYTEGCISLYGSDAAGPITLRNSILTTVSADCCPGPTVSPVQATGSASQSLYTSYSALFAIGGGGVTVPVSSLFSGVVPLPVNCLLEINPNLLDDYSVGPSSPCVNAGPPDPIYNNRDGTRNTMGYTGGPYWNPANYTNNNPIVFFLTGQQTVLSGVQTNIQINAAAAAGH